MQLHICNECVYKTTCPEAFKTELELWCKHPNERIMKEQNKRFDDAHKDDWGYWYPQ